jgi:hypothetical protein
MIIEKENNKNDTKPRRGSRSKNHEMICISLLRSFILSILFYNHCTFSGYIDMIVKRE